MARNEAAEAEAASAKLSPPQWVGWVYLIAAVGLVVTGLYLFNVFAPHNTSLIQLQWSGSPAVAMAVVRGRAGDFRAGLRWDLMALVPGYALSLLVACRLGRLVFWTSELHFWAGVGMAMSVAAGALNVVQDWLLFIALDDGLRGRWIFRWAEAFSFAKFSALLVAGTVGVLALATTYGRLLRHRRTREHWRQTLRAASEDRRPVAVPPPLIEMARASGGPAAAGSPAPARGALAPAGSAAAADHAVCRCWWDVCWGAADACCTRQRSTAPLDADLSRPELFDAGLCRCWWDRRTGGPHLRWAQGFASPREWKAGRTGICVSGGGIRSASVALGALQALNEERALTEAEYLVSVSGGGFTTGAFQLALNPPGGFGAPPPGTAPDEGAAPGNVFAAGSAEEDHLRRHSSYIAAGLGQWVMMLAVLFRCVVSSFLVNGMIIVALGAAIGGFYSHVPIVNLARLRPLFLHSTVRTAPGYPPVPPGVVLAIGCTAGLAMLAYLFQLAALPQRPGERRLSRIAKALTAATALLVAIGVALPALIWASARLGWVFGPNPLPVLSVGSLGVGVSYLGAMAATLWRKRKTIAKTARTTADLARDQVNAVLPHSMIQMIIMWICLAVLILAALIAGGWVATSSLVVSWHPLVPLALLAFVANLVDQTSLSLHPFYRRRLASAFAVRRAARAGGDVAVPYREDEMTYLSLYGSRRPGFPGVTFNATANITGQDRTPPGRPAVPYTLAHDYIGGPQVGWVRTDFLTDLASRFLQVDLTVQAAVAISGAAFSSAMGSRTRFYEVFLALSNARLGAWLPNPYFIALKLQHLDDWTIPGLPARRGLSYLAREVFGLHPGTSRLLLCTDGGHYDNLGLVEVLRRRCDRIYCIDASRAVPPLNNTLAEAIALAREELGVEITLTDGALGLDADGRDFRRPAAQAADLNKRLSESAVAVGEITYPEIPGDRARSGQLVFAQAVLTPDMPYQLLEFRQSDPGFPRNSTADQWFSSSHFNAYQLLGHVMGRAAAAISAVPSGAGPRGGRPQRRPGPWSTLGAIFRRSGP